MMAPAGGFGPEIGHQIRLYYAYLGIIYVFVICMVLYAILVNIENKPKSKKKTNKSRNIIAIILRLTATAIIVSYALFFLSVIISG